MSGKSLIQALTKVAPSDQSGATLSQISTRPKHSDITGHKLLIFHFSDIALPLIEFTPCYQCLKESCPPLPAPPRWSLFTWRRTSNLPCRSSTRASLVGRDDMETDHRGKNEICLSSNLDKNHEQQRWVTSCFTLLPWAFKPTGIIYDYVPHLSVRHYITVLVYQCRWRSINSTCRFKNRSFQRQG